MPAGRPTKYSPKIIDQINDYMATYEDRGEVIPSIEGLSLFLEIGERTLYTWQADETKTDFRQALANLKARQRLILVGKGLTGDFNSAIAKLVLSANHGMHEKQGREMTGPDGGPIETVNRIERHIVRP